MKDSVFRKISIFEIILLAIDILFVIGSVVYLILYGQVLDILLNTTMYTVATIVLLVVNIISAVLIAIFMIYKKIKR